MRKVKKLKQSREKVYTSPDGGETVYVQKKDGTRGRLVSQTQMRRKYPALGKAWKHYKTVWHLIMGNK